MSERHFLRLIFPPHKGYLKIIQDSAISLASICGVDSKRHTFIMLAIEEALMTILNYAYSEDTSEDIEVEIKAEAGFFVVHFISKGMPFELPEIQDLKPSDIDSLLDKETPSLSLFMLKNAVDSYRFVNRGKEGVLCELKWHIHQNHIKDIDSSIIATSQTSIEEIKGIRVLLPEDAIQIARIIYKSYGLSYVHEDMYYPERIRARLTAGLIQSIGVVTTSDKIIAHLALMKDAENPSAIEWGMVVVDPLYRSKGLMRQLLDFAVTHTDCQREPVLYAHAVTNHPFTQKTCETFGFRCTALLVGYGPQGIKFKSISDELSQRESTYIAQRLFKPLPKQRLYIPKWHKDTLLKIFELMDIPYTEDSVIDDGYSPSHHTVYKSNIITALNIANIIIDKVGNDIYYVLTFEKMRLCSERVDVIYLIVDLADPMVSDCVQGAEKIGFFLAGFTAMQPHPYGLTLQYLNNIKIDFAKITSFAEHASWLKDIVIKEQARVLSL